MTDTDARGIALPTGTVTFLLTDVEASTRKWETARFPATLTRPVGALAEPAAFRPSHKSVM